MKHIIILISALLILPLAAQDAPESALTWSVTAAGNANEFDASAARFTVAQENAKRAQDLDEDGNPKLPPLPDTGAGLKRSYESVMAAFLAARHARLMVLAAQEERASKVNEKWNRLEPNRRQLIIELLEKGADDDWQALRNALQRSE